MFGAAQQVCRERLGAQKLARPKGWAAGPLWPKRRASLAWDGRGNSGQAPRGLTVQTREGDGQACLHSWRKGR